jgi:hypothetical protein
MKKIALLFIAIAIISCNSKNYQHNGTYQNSLGNIYKIKNDSITLMNMSPEIKDSVKIACTQYTDRIECKQIDGTTATLLCEKDGGISDGFMFFRKIK